MRILTGDTPTGKLHLGHYVGSLENRLNLQTDHECYYLLANKHAFTTNADNPQQIRQNTLDVALDWLSVGLDPDKCSMLIQSEVPAIDELTFYFAMLLPFNRVMKNPTLKSEIRMKNLGDTYPFGFPLYSVGQTADILAFRPDVVPVGKDQLPHLEMTREVARRFNQLYCGVAPETPDSEHLAAGGLFPVIDALLGRVERLVGTTGPGEDGELAKMSKSLKNHILLSDSPEAVQKAVMKMYTDPNRIRATDPGTVEGNPLWIFHETFNPDKAWVAEHEDLYRQGKVGDVDMKRKLVEVINDFLDPIRQRRLTFETRPDTVIDILKVGTAKANEVANATLDAAKRAMKQDYFSQ
ncbi:MAG: tryptophan--tRNA ligase [Planctomycetota bacterium]|nr:tryptophan--tRNA ligase [Planctomycetota bacterium]